MPARTDPRDPRRAALLLVLGSLCSCAPEGSAPQGAAPEPRTRIVLITLDTLRYDSFAGTEEVESAMPYTRALAAGGLIFEEAYACTSSTQPTHASLFTGLQPWQHGVTHNGAVLGQDHDTLAELLRTTGYATEAVVASFPLERRFHFNQGFDTYRDRFARALRGVEEWKGEPVEGREFYSLSESVTSQALELLDAAQGERQFFWFHYFDAHAPYGDAVGKPLATPVARMLKDGSPELTEEMRRLRAVYDQDVAFLDGQLERLYARLRADAGEYTTHLVITADHGESLGEDGTLGHERRLSDVQLHVPLIVVSPEVAPGVRRDPVGSVDVFHTILSLAGIEAGASRGRDLLAGELSPDTAVAGMRSTTAGPLLFFEVRGGRIYTGDGQGLSAGATELAPPADVAAELRETFQRFTQALQAVETTGLEDAETRRGLEALGY